MGAWEHGSMGAWEGEHGSMGRVTVAWCVAAPAPIATVAVLPSVKGHLSIARVAVVARAVAAREVAENEVMSEAVLRAGKVNEAAREAAVEEAVRPVVRARASHRRWRWRGWRRRRRAAVVSA